jgi:transcription elongation factor Elf1
MGILNFLRKKRPESLPVEDGFVIKRNTKVPVDVTIVPAAPPPSIETLFPGMLTGKMVRFSCKKCSDINVAPLRQNTEALKAFVVCGNCRTRFYEDEIVPLTAHPLFFNMRYADVPKWARMPTSKTKLDSVEEREELRKRSRLPK